MHVASLPKVAAALLSVQPHPPAARPIAPRPTAPRPPVYVVRGRPGPDDRPCLPSGHPDTWGRITQGTVLDGAPYPFPIFGS